MRRRAERAAVQAIAALEAGKGALALAAGAGLAGLEHGRAREAAESLIRHLRLDPAGRYPRMILDAASGLTDDRLAFFAALAIVYGVVRMVEAYGLWRNRDWAKLFGIVTSAIYVPFELWELVRDPSWVPAAALVVNVAVVVVLWKARDRPPRGESDRLTPA